MQGVRAQFDIQVRPPGSRAVRYFNRIAAPVNGNLAIRVVEIKTQPQPRFTHGTGGPGAGGSNTPKKSLQYLVEMLAISKNWHKKVDCSRQSPVKGPAYSALLSEYYRSATTQAIINHLLDDIPDLVGQLRDQ